jgi:hypothetical protein
VKQTFAHSRATAWALLAALLTAAMIHFLPYLINYKYIVAQVVWDDNVFAYRAISNHLERFTGDLVQFAHRGYLWGSLINYGSLFVDKWTPIPLEVIYNALVFFQLFSLPALFVWFLKNRLTSYQLFSVFLLVTLSEFSCWNFANYTELSALYAALVAMPFVWLGLYWISQGRILGYGALSLACLIHASLGLYAILIAFLFLVSARKKLSIPKLLMLAIPTACAVAPATIILSADFPKVPLEDLMRALELNSHATPWDDSFSWPRAFPATVAFALLAAVSYPDWGRLGKPYGRLLKCAAVAVLILCLSQIVGHLLDIPKLVQLIGLRSPTVFALLFLPILALFLFDRLAHQKLFVRFLAAFLFLLMIVGQPYGIDKMPIVFLGAWFWLFKDGKQAPKTGRYLAWTIYGLAVAWFASWVFAVPRRLIIFSPEHLEVLATPWSFWIYLKENALIDSGVRLVRQHRFIVVLSALLVAAWPLFERLWVQLPRVRIKISQGMLIAAFLVASLALVTAANFQEFGSQASRDLYAAEVWAKNNTPENARFIVQGHSWRTFSERAMCHPMPALYFYYYPDMRMKAIDDMLIRLFGLEETYQTGTQNKWMFATMFIYSKKVYQPEPLRKLGKLVGARYVVSKYPVDLPVAYANKTYRIYDLRMRTR